MHWCACSITWLGAFPRGIVAAAGVTFSAGLIAAAVLMTTGQREWPGRLEKIAIVDSRIVDVAAGSLVEAQTIYIKDGADRGSRTSDPPSRLAAYSGISHRVRRSVRSRCILQGEPQTHH